MRKLLICVFLVMCQCLVVQAQIPTDSLICHYTFNNNFNDLAGTNHGTNNGAVFTTDRFGNPNHAIYLDGNGNSVDFGDIPLEAPMFTVSFWMNYDSVASGEYRILAKREVCSSGNFFDISVSDSASGMECYSGSNSSGNAAGGGIVTPGKWHHIAYVVDSSSQQTLKYIDGVLEATKIWTLQMGSMDNTAAFGVSNSPCINGSGVHAYKGNIDDIRVYTRPLLPAEITELANEANPALGLEEKLSSSAMLIYPNPAQDRLQVKIERHQIQSIQVLDRLGRTVLTQTGGQTHIILGHLPSGSYLVSVETKKGHFRKAFIKY